MKEYKSILHRDALKDEDSNYEVKDDSDFSFILLLTQTHIHTLKTHPNTPSLITGPCNSSPQGRLYSSISDR